MLGHSDIKLKNITDISQKTLRIADLQGKTSYHLVLRAYTHGGLGPEKSMFVVTKENCEFNTALETPSPLLAFGGCPGIFVPSPKAVVLSLPGTVTL